MPLSPQYPGQLVDEFGEPIQRPQPGMPMDLSVLPQTPENPGGLTTPQPVPPRITSQQASDFYQQTRKPPPWGPGRIASTIIGAPFKILGGLDQELKGTLGIPTLEDYANPGRAIYGGPVSESRAFGASVADEPDFGDRFTGAVTGQTRRDMNAYAQTAELIRQRNALRKNSLRETKDVQDIFKSTIDAFSAQRDAEIKAQYAELDAKIGLESKRAATYSANASGNLSTLRAQTLRDEEARKAEVAAMLAAGGELPATAGDVTGMVQGNPNRARQLPFLLDLAQRRTALDAAEAARRAEEEATPMLGGVPPAVGRAAGQGAEGLRSLEQLFANPIDPETGLPRSMLTQRGYAVEDDMAKQDEAERNAESARILATIDDLARTFAERTPAESTIESPATAGIMDFFGIDSDRATRDAILQLKGELEDALRKRTVRPEEAGRVASGKMPLAEAEKIAQAAAEKVREATQEWEAEWELAFPGRPKQGPDYNIGKRQYLKEHLGQ